MADIRCPMCSKPNPSDLDVCQYCGARLKPLIQSSGNNSTPIKAGDQPVPKGTGALDAAKLRNVSPIRPGEAPTDKKTSDLEKALPSWLRDLRDDQAEAATPSADDQPSFESTPEAPAGSGESQDWLAGFGQAGAAEDESVPDWLAGLRGDKPAEPAADQAPQAEPGVELGNDDWMSRLGSSSTSPSPAPFEPDAPAEANEETSSWLKSLQSYDAGPSEPAAPAKDEKLPEWYSGLPGISAETPLEETPAPAASQPFEGEVPATPNESLPDWLSQLQDNKVETEPPAPSEPAGASAFSEDIPDWLSQLPTTAAEVNAPTQPEPPAQPAFSEDTPDWLKQLPGASVEAPAETPAEAGSTPDWLNAFQEKAIEPEPASPGKDESVPDWLSNLEAPTSAAPSEQALPDWLSNVDATPGAATPGPAAFTAETPAESTTAAEPAEMPAWLSQMQAGSIPLDEADATPPALESSPEAAAVPAVLNDSVPDWLKGIEPPAEEEEKPSAFVQEGAAPPAETGEKAFSMETPDWLSRLKPEEPAEKPALVEESGAPADSIEAGALPSWVQAMRPVESVVDETKTAPAGEDQVVEQSGPLAGLVGVLPAGAGLGMSRKPPAYSVKLQVSSTQQQYISNLEKLVASETRPSALKAERKQSDRLIRWILSAILLAAVILPFLFPQVRLTPPAVTVPSDKYAAKAVIEGLPSGAAVLIAFDYSPSLSGELESVAAPLIDQLQAKGARLTLVSTSPTGAALGERFLHSTLLVNSHAYKAGEQYVDLGYLPGGPAGISFFASAPEAAMPFTSLGRAAWSQAPLQGVSKLSDFAAVMVLTDDADTGRNWVEQAGRSLGSAPMLMVISAQAEPMVRPYFDSGQLKALVSGLPDAKKYEQQFNRPGLANHYWDSFSLVGFLAGLIILFGAAWSALLAWRDLLHKPKEKA